MAGAAAAQEGPRLILGRYRPIQPLGSGGSGTVWLVRDVLEDRDVALKVVPREGKAGERAEREAHAVARLRSRHCARAYSVQRDDRHVYVAYEYVPGKTMREAIRAGDLDDSGAVEAAAQILDALAHAHRRKVIHRDVKPANVLVEEGDEVSIRLLDFGLAQLEEADTLTAAGDVPGTLAYISPERLAGKPTTGAADVWAVGVILWESLAGYQPFWSTSPVETARLIGAGAPSLAKVRPDLPRALTTAVDRALAAEPRRRPAPERLARDLRTAAEAAGRRREHRSPLARATLVRRAIPAVAAGTFVALACTLLPFFPIALVAAIATVAGLASLLDPRAGLALALLAPVLPLGNVSTALALAWLPLAAAWLALGWRDARHALLCVSGPLLAFAGMLPLAPLVCERASGPARRFAQGAAAVILAAAVCGLRGTPLPFTGETPPLGLGIEGSESVMAVAGALWGALAAEPVLLIEALALGAAAAALPVVRSRPFGLWGIAAFGAVYTALAVLVPTLTGSGDVASFPILLSTWAIVAIVAIPELRTLLRTRAATVQ
jgi:eukaryotic-like serine/threonine-protein kinase